MKKIIASILAAFFVLFFPLSAFASTTESVIMYASLDEYGVMPLYIYDEGYINTHFSFAIGDYNINKYDVFSDVTVDQQLPTHSRFTQEYGFYNVIRNFDTVPPNYNSIRIRQVITDAAPNADNPIFALEYFGYILDVYGLSFYLYEPDSNGNPIIGEFLTSTDFPKPVIKYYNEDQDGNIVSSGVVNPNDIVRLNQSIAPISFTYTTQPATVPDQVYIKKVTIDYYFDISSFSNISDISNLWLRTLFVDNGYIYGSDVDKVGSDNDYEKDVVGELGNIQSGINNVVNSVQTMTSNVVSSITNMANQAWQSAQQTVQSISNMTTQLTNTLNQQRQDILDGLGLLGDDITGTLGDVKTEITNIGSSITNKLESTTETITNTIETKVDEVTESVGEVKQSILDLPNKIKDMLLGLIVPDSDTMANKYSEFSGLLEQKLGVIYQIPMMLFDFFDTIVNAATTPQSTLTLPAFQLPWIDGSTLTVWQPMEYKIIPDGMQVLSDLIKTITSMTVVVLTFNSVKRAYERFLRS